MDRALLKALLRMFASLGIYGDAFERPLLEQTDSFYGAESTRRLEQCEARSRPGMGAGGRGGAGRLRPARSRARPLLVAGLIPLVPPSHQVPEYLLHVEARLAEEGERCAQYLDGGTRKPLVAAVERQLIERHVGRILEKGFAALMAAQRTADVARLYGLLGRVGKLDELRAALGAYVRATVGKIVQDEEKEDAIVPSLLATKARLDCVLRDSLGGNPAFAAALKDAFEAAVNSRAGRPAELVRKAAGWGGWRHGRGGGACPWGPPRVRGWCVGGPDPRGGGAQVARHIDSVLRVGNKTQSDEELESSLDQADSPARPSAQSV